MFDLFRDLDLFDKTDRDELKERSRIGSAFTLATFCLTLLALAYHFTRMLRSDIYRELQITPTFTNQHELLNISLSVDVDLPCYFLHVDALDSLGSRQLDINTTVTLRRLSINGTVIGISNSTFGGVCLPCYGLAPEGHCCNSCDQLFFLSMISSRPPTPEKWIQCQQNGVTKPADVSLDEKCRLKGKITANKIAGRFHIAAGRNSPGGPMHQHDLSFQFPDLSFRHKIEKIRFGPKLPTISEPLTDITHQQRTDGPAMYRYDLRVTPVLVYVNGRRRESGYEYQALQSQVRGAPGLFFSYGFSPYAVAVHVRTRKLAQEGASLAGFLAGVWALMSMGNRMMAVIVDRRK
jgi:hypothetical protein